MRKSKKVEKVDEALNHSKKLNDYLMKYGEDVESDVLKTMIAIDMSEIVFDQHSNSKNKLNAVMIAVQLVLCFISTFLQLFNINISIVTAGINLAILGFVLVNNEIHTKEWEKSKERVKLLEYSLNMLRLNAEREFAKSLKEKGKEAVLKMFEGEDENDVEI